MLVASAALTADPADFSGKENMEKSTKSNLTSYVNKIDATDNTIHVKRPRAVRAANAPPSAHM